MAITAIAQGTVFSGNTGSDLAARAIPDPFPLERAGKAGAAGFPAAGTGVSGAGTFGENLERALSEVENRSREADSAAARYAAGEPVEIHTVVIAAEQARLSIMLAAEVRNKVVEAYQELTRTAG